MFHFIWTKVALFTTLRKFVTIFIPPMPIRNIYAPGTFIQLPDHGAGNNMNFYSIWVNLETMIIDTLSQIKVFLHFAQMHTTDSLALEIGSCKVYRVLPSVWNLQIVRCSSTLLRRRIRCGCIFHWMGIRVLWWTHLSFG